MAEKEIDFEKLNKEIGDMVGSLMPLTKYISESDHIKDGFFEFKVLIKKEGKNIKLYPPSLTPNISIDSEYKDLEG